MMKFNIICVMITVSFIVRSHQQWSNWRNWKQCDQRSITSRLRTCLMSYCAGSASQRVSCALSLPISKWSTWSKWVPQKCQFVETRQRNCVVPCRMQYIQLHGPSIQTRSSVIYNDHKNCPNLDMWTQWNNWSNCINNCNNSKQSNINKQSRKRMCIKNKIKSGTSNACKGKKETSRSCQTRICVIHSRWSKWNKWIITKEVLVGKLGCTETKIMKRDRTVTIKPQYGGQYMGSTVMKLTKMTKQCKVNKEYHSWGQWSKCDSNCLKIRPLGIMERKATCDKTMVQYGGRCIGNDKITQICSKKHCKISGIWSKWTKLEDCKRNCQQMYSHISWIIYERYCSNQKNSDSCIGVARKAIPCKINECPNNGIWTSWTSYSICSTIYKCKNHLSLANYKGVYGKKNRRRTCDISQLQYGGACIGPDKESIVCTVQPCPVHSMWNSWKQWSDCLGTCVVNNIMQSSFRNRKRTAPPTQYQGTLLGQNEQIMACLTRTCPVHQHWLPWIKINVVNQCKPIGSPSKTNCKIGILNITRKMSGYLQYSGLIFGSSYKIVPCKLRACPVNAKWQTWSKWTKRVTPCDFGTFKTRKRTTTNQLQYGGICFGQSKQTITSQLQRCGKVKFDSCNITYPIPESKYRCQKAMDLKINCATPAISLPKSDSYWFGFFGIKLYVKEVYVYQSNLQDIAVTPGKTSIYKSNNSKACSSLFKNTANVINALEVIRAFRCNQNASALRVSLNGLSEPLKLCEVEVIGLVYPGPTPWSQWDLCSKSCNDGIKRRTRTCLASAHDPDICQNKLTESKTTCLIRKCPKEFEFNWKKWIEQYWYIVVIVVTFLFLLFLIWIIRKIRKKCYSSVLGGYSKRKKKSKSDSKNKDGNKIMIPFTTTNDEANTKQKKKNTRRRSLRKISKRLSVVSDSDSLKDTLEIEQDVRRVKKHATILPKTFYLPQKKSYNDYKAFPNMLLPIKKPSKSLPVYTKNGRKRRLLTLYQQNYLKYITKKNNNLSPLSSDNTTFDYDDDQDYFIDDNDEETLM